MKLRRPFAVLAVSFAAALASTGCFQVQYDLTLDSDLAGTVSMLVTVDLDRMAMTMATAQRAMTGQEGPPTEEEIEAARAELQKQMEEGVLEEENLVAELTDELPEGFELIDARQEHEGLRTSVAIDLAFDHVRRLSEMDVAPGETGGGDILPFGGFEVVEEGNTLVFRDTEPFNPMEEVEENAGGLLDSDEMIREMFSDLRIAFTLTAPFEVIEHNATSQEGSKLSWVYDYETLTAGTPEGIYVRYRK